MVVVAVIKGVAAEDINAAKRADATIPRSMGESMLIIREGRACSAWMVGKRNLAQIPNTVMAKANGTRITAAVAADRLAICPSFAKNILE
jgi:hypothetical protein